jgi:BirA family biotin operon repressor/biotin-[acetyl-CoA-carboxylase] ligase
VAERAPGSQSPGVEAGSYDGVETAELARRWSVPAVHAFREIGSTLDAAHAMAPVAAAGTLILADEQTAGRGRHGRRWTSAPNAGVWLTLIERPADARALDVLALRCGLYAAESLDALSLAPVDLKWPNDLYVRGRKLAGILIETRWRGASAEWVAIGFGLNVAAPDLETASGLAPHATRLAALDCLVPALRRASTAAGHLSADELSRWAARDIGPGRVASEPAAGIVQGISATGEVNIADSEGRISAHRSGSLTFVAPLQCS